MPSGGLTHLVQGNLVYEPRRSVRINRSKLAPPPWASLARTLAPDQWGRIVRALVRFADAGMRLHNDGCDHHGGGVHGEVVFRVRSSCFSSEESAAWQRSSDGDTGALEFLDAEDRMAAPLWHTSVFPDPSYRTGTSVRATGTQGACRTSLHGTLKFADVALHSMRGSHGMVAGAGNRCQHRAAAQRSARRGVAGCGGAGRASALSQPRGGRGGGHA